MSTPREVLAQAFRSRSDRGYARADEVLADLLEAGFEVLPTSRVDAVLVADPLPLSAQLGDARAAILAYREATS